MNIAFESELMENQKHAVVMAPDLAFEVLQSQDGDALFFSIGTDNIFYLTREVTQTSTGWNKIDLSSTLSSQHGGAAVEARTFSVAQNAQTLGIDLALVLTVGGTDFLYLSLGNANTDAAWANGVAWTAIPFDAGTAPTPITIADVLLMNIPAVGGPGAVENIFVDILRTPGDPLKLLDRYYIKPGGSPQWNPHTLAADLAAGSISSCLGQPTDYPLPGIYTFGTISTEQELLFTPQSNFFKPADAPPVSRLTVPAGASAIASALNGAGVSNLFVAGTDGLFLFTPDNQGDNATPAMIVSNGLVAGASALAAATDANRTAVWGLDPQGNLFYVTCPAGSEADPTAWSIPIPLVVGVEGFAFFLNLKAGNNILFAHLNGQNLIQLSQDPVTTDWLQRSILLPSTNPNDIAVYNSFTTHIQVTDDNGVGALNTAVAVTATSPVSVYLNDVYYRLSTTVAVNVATDATGVLTVVQETQSLAGVCFQIALSDGSGVKADINPMSKAMTILSKIQSGSDLGSVKVTNADSTQQSLVPTSVSSDDKEAAAKSLVQFVKINAGLPQNGSRQTPAGAAANVSTVPQIWGVSFGSGGLEYHEGEDTAQHFGLRTVVARPALAAGASPALGSIDSDIEVAAGDFFRWARKAYDDVDSFVVQEAEGFYHFFATIGGKVYDALLDCIDAVVHAVEFVFNKIKVFLEDLIKWLGFLFEWGDILRTHGVLKNILNQYLAQCINNMENARARLQNTFTDVEKYIDAWAGIPDNIPPSLSGANLNSSSSTASSNSVPGQNSPQSNWGMHHLKSNAANGSTTAQPNKGIVGDIVAVIQPLVDALEREKEVFQAAFGSFKSDIIDKIHELSFAELIKAVVAIIADALLESIENVLLAAIDVLIALSEGVMDALNATIEIPVISWLYKKFVGDLSLLDLTCLVSAIPVTVGYKLITNGTAPFPDNATTTALINAPDFASIQKIYNPVQTFAANVADRTTAKVADTTARATSTSTSDNKIVVLAGGIASAEGALALCYFSPLKQKFPKIPLFPVITGLAYPLYVAPDIMGQIPDLQDKKWWAITNEVITDLMVVKSMVDMGVALTAVGSAAQNAWNPVSPWLDFAGNILWQVPTTAALFDSENQNTPGILSYWGGTCFDCNGVMSPAVAEVEDPISWAIAVGIATFFNLGYGSMSCAASVLTFKS
jgi:hypothetical protein